MKEQDAIKSVLTALSDGFEHEADGKYGEWAKKTINAYSYLDIKDPEKFSLLLSQTTQQQINVLLRSVISNEQINKKNLYKLQFVYEYYSFIKSHLDKIIKDYEGWACSADKTRWLIGTYVNYLRTDTMPEIKTQQYWTPKIEDMNLWIRWVDAMYPLYYGDDSEYVRAKQQLCDAYERKVVSLILGYDRGFRAHPFFYLCEEGTKYYFKEQASNNLGTIVIDKKANLRYRFTQGAEQTSLRYDDLPEWFLNLLEIQG